MGFGKAALPQKAEALPLYLEAVMTNTPLHNEACLVTAKDLEKLGILPKGTAWKMAAGGTLPHYVVGCRGRGIRFKVDEVLAALRRPSSSQEAVPK